MQWSACINLPSNERPSMPSSRRAEIYICVGLLSTLHFCLCYRTPGMQASSSRAVHLSEWQKSYFAVTAGPCAAGQKADAYRAQILRIQYAWANSEISQACASKLFKRYAEKYSAVVDSDSVATGLSNYAEDILTLARPRQTGSDEWQSGLSVTSVCLLYTSPSPRDLH